MNPHLDVLQAAIEKATGIVVTEIEIRALDGYGEGSYEITMTAFTKPIEKVTRVFPWEAK